MANPVEPVTGRDAFTVTASDTTVRAFNALWIGGAGNVTIRTRGGSTVEFTGIAAGSVFPMSGDMVKAATTATGIVGITY